MNHNLIDLMEIKIFEHIKDKREKHICGFFEHFLGRWGLCMAFEGARNRFNEVLARRKP